MPCTLQGRKSAHLAIPKDVCKKYIGNNYQPAVVNTHTSALISYEKTCGYTKHPQEL